MVTAPLGVGRRIVAPLIPEFHAAFPGIEVRLRLSDRKVDYLAEGVDVAFALGTLEDSSLKMRTIADCERVLCAAPAYLAARGAPETPHDLLAQHHNCLLLRFPGSHEYYWTFSTHDGPLKITPHGTFDADDADVLTDWALAGRRHRQPPPLRDRPPPRVRRAGADPRRHPAAADPLRLPLPAPPAPGPEGAGLHPLDDRALPEPGAGDPRE